MLDLFGIMFSSSIMWLVILRAIQLDGLLPWFRPPRTGTDSSGLRLRPGQGQGQARGNAGGARSNPTRGG